MGDMDLSPGHLGAFSTTVTPVMDCCLSPWLQLENSLSCPQIPAHFKRILRRSFGWGTALDNTVPSSVALVCLAVHRTSVDHKSYPFVAILCIFVGSGKWDPRVSIRMEEHWSLVVTLASEIGLIAELRLLSVPQFTAGAQWLAYIPHS